MPRGGFDSEYASLMAELGETPADPSKNWSAPSMGHDMPGGNIPPWRRPEVWAPPPPQQQQYRGAPQGGYGGYPGAAGGYGDPSTQYQGYGQAPAGYGQPQDYNYAAYYQGQYAQQQMS